LNIKKDNKKDTPAPPSFDEWRDFLGEVVLHWFSVDFIAVAFRGIPYHEMMSQEDFEDIQLDDEELSSVARPFAHLITHSSVNTKYGRSLLNMRDSIEAAVVMFMWGSRVRRISRKYRFIMNTEVQNVARIPRPDRTRDSEQESTEEEAEAFRPIVGAQRAAFGHGFN